MNNELQSLELNSFYHCDCLEGIKLIPDDYIDLTVTSPPYDELRSYEGFNFNFKETAKQLLRVTKSGGVVVWIVGDATIKGCESLTSFTQALYFKELGFNVHDTMIYEKINPTPMKGNRYQQSFEYMFILSKGKPKTFNPLKIKKKYMENRKNKKYNKAVDGKTIEHVYKANSEMKTIHNIWRYTVGLYNSTSDKIAFQHPAIFPEKLAEDHILSWSNEGDIVLDPFMGSGTVAKMALLNKRKYIGFEVSNKYIQIANERVEKLKS
ncbi:site-specific DNA-methyltransferase [Paenibacillus sp. Marseille-Q4541]|uniref:DNA-methyltransferase n=1 Tax=Paenibacillus sp. Marseille-Q4541 TaxID=2831522 RepID=UPI002019E085|nr:site-specific DNA-methyltransferase [Paenibacillus sp. Marseille-Q4541]